MLEKVNVNYETRLEQKLHIEQKEDRHNHKYHFIVNENTKFITSIAKGKEIINFLRFLKEEQAEKKYKFDYRNK